jgi:hypothetical protein
MQMLRQLKQKRKSMLKSKWLLLVLVAGMFWSISDSADWFYCVAEDAGTLYITKLFSSDRSSWELQVAMGKIVTSVSFLCPGDSSHSMAESNRRDLIRIARNRGMSIQDL